MSAARQCGKSRHHALKPGGKKLVRARVGGDTSRGWNVLTCWPYRMTDAPVVALDDAPVVLRGAALRTADTRATRRSTMIVRHGTATSTASSSRRPAGISPTPPRTDRAPIARRCSEASAVSRSPHD